MTNPSPRRKGRSFKRAETALPISLLTAILWVTVVAALPVWKQSHAQTPQPREAISKPGSAQFSELNNEVLQLIEATEFNRALGPALKALKIAQSDFGPNDERLANIKNSLGVIYGRLGDHKASEPFLFAAKAIWQANNNKLMTAYADNNIAGRYLALSQFSDAEKFYRSALDVRRSLLGDRDALTVATLANLATTLIFEGRLAEGEEKVRQVIQLREQLLGLENAATLSTLGLLGFCLIKEMSIFRSKSNSRSGRAVFS